MSAPRREPSVVAETHPANDTAELIALEKYRALGGESHRVLRCLETILATDRYEIVDTGQIARFLGIRSQAVSRALKSLVEQSIIERGRRIGRSHTFRRLDAAAKPAAEDGILRLDAAQAGDVRNVWHFLKRNGPGFDEDVARKYLKFGMVLYVLQDGLIAGAALIDYNSVIDSGPTIAHLIVDRQLRSLGHGRKFLIQIERHFHDKRIFAHAPVGNKELIITLLKHGFDIVGQQVTDGDIALILKKSPGV
jgi:DNA-binding transcriptional ArsR family regulator